MKHAEKLGRKVGFRWEKKENSFQHVENKNIILCVGGRGYFKSTFSTIKRIFCPLISTKCVLCVCVCVCVCLCAWWMYVYLEFTNCWAVQHNVYTISFF
jgi:hypothetical protein